MKRSPLRNALGFASLLLALGLLAAPHIVSATVPGPDNEPEYACAIEATDPVGGDL